jgi:hypothetical protein
MFKRKVTVEHKQNKMIEKEIDMTKHMHDLTICVPLMGNATHIIS